MKTAAIFTLLLCACSLSCRTTKTTTDRHTETLVSIRPVTVPYDTTVHLQADSLDFTADVPVIGGTARMDSIHFERNGLQISASIKNGRLTGRVIRSDTGIYVQGTTTALIADTTRKETTTITKKIRESPLIQALRLIPAILLIAFVLYLIAFRK